MTQTILTGQELKDLIQVSVPTNASVVNFSDELYAQWENEHTTKPKYVGAKRVITIEIYEAID